MIRVKPLNIDDSPKYTYRTRVAKIKISSSVSVETPIRAITNSEMNAKKTIPTPVEIDAEVGGVVLKFTNKKIRNVIEFISNNKKINDTRKKVDTYLNSMLYSDMNYVLLQPTKKAIEDLQSSEDLLNSFIRIQAKLQDGVEDSKLNIITIPWLNLPIGKFKAVHKEYTQAYSNKTIMPVIDPACNNNLWDELLKYIVSCENTDTLNIIGVIYRSFESHMASYDKLWAKLHDKDIGIVLIDTDRRLMNDYNLSGLHYGEFIIGDILSSKVPVGGFPDISGERKNSKPPIEYEFKFFRKDSLDVVPLYELQKSNPNWVEDILLETGETYVKKALNNYHEAENDSKKKQIINAISKVHEFKSSRGEFLISQKYIKQNDALSYIQEKPTLSKKIIQTRLNGFK
jgi:hypothetical protein